MKKKLIATLLLVTLTMTTALTGCGAGDKETAGSDVSNGVESNVNTTVNNDTDSSAESDTTKEDTQKVEYSKDDVIIEIAGISFSLYDTWETIEPKLQNVGIKTTDNAGDPDIIINGTEMMNIIVNLWDTTEEGTYIKTLTFCEYGGNETNRELIKVNGYSLDSVVDVGNDYKLEDISIDTKIRYKGYITEEVSLKASDNGGDVVEWHLIREDLKK